MALSSEQRAGMGQFFSASSIPEVAAGGKSMLANERRKQNQIINLGRGVLYRPGTDKAFMPEAYRKAVEGQRAYELEGLNTMLDSGRFPIPGDKPSKGQEGKARESYRLSQEAKELQKQVIENPDALGTVADPLLDWMRSGTQGGIITQLAPAVERMFYDRKDLKLRTSLAR